jgi:hypothetical protein
MDSIADIRVGDNALGVAFTNREAAPPRQGHCVHAVRSELFKVLDEGLWVGVH